jgi:hypothetical protein
MPVPSHGLRLLRARARVVEQDLAETAVDEVISGPAEVFSAIPAARDDRVRSAV